MIQEKKKLLSGSNLSLVGPSFTTTCSQVYYGRFMIANLGKQKSAAFNKTSGISQNQVQSASIPLPE